MSYQILTFPKFYPNREIKLGDVGTAGEDGAKLTLTNSGMVWNQTPFVMKSHNFVVQVTPMKRNLMLTYCFFWDLEPCAGQHVEVNHYPAGIEIATLDATIKSAWFLILSNINNSYAQSKLEPFIQRNRIS